MYGQELSTPLGLKNIVVNIRHPSTTIPMLFLRAHPRNVDVLDNNPDNYGVEHRVVMDACFILTNGLEGVLKCYSQLSGIAERVCTSAFMTTGEYVYVVSSEPDYPLVATLDAWIPPVRVPDHWRRTRSPEIIANLIDLPRAPNSTAMSSVVKSKDKHCLITKFSSSLENAHIVPKEHKDWFQAHAMARHATTNVMAGINSISNGITLRSDVHRLLNRHGLIIHPGEEIGNNQYRMYTTYGLADPGGVYAHFLHRRLVTIPSRVADAFLYARFAYTVINIASSSEASSTCPIPDSVAQRKANNRKASGTNKKLSSRLDRILEGATRGDVENAAELEMTGDVEGAEDVEDVEEDGEEEDGDADEDHYVDEDGDVEEAEDDCEEFTTGTLFSSKPDDHYGETDKKWKDLMLESQPELAYEYAHPTDELSGCHVESPRMFRLMSDYKKQNPQVWQTAENTSVRPRDGAAHFANLAAEYVTRITAPAQT